MNNLKSEYLKKIKQLFICILTAALIIALMPANNISAKTSGDITVDISLPTIQCGMCESTIENALDKIKGVKDYDFDLEGKKVTVTYDESKTNISKIEKAITKAGYDANSRKADKKAYNKLDECCKVK